MSTNRLEEYKTLASGNVCDAMELLGLRRSVIHGFTFVAPQGSILVGPAFTIRQIPKRGTASSSAKLVRHAEVSDRLAQQGDVVVIDVGGMLEVCSWGEIHSVRCKKRGVAGLIINGCVRDVDAIRQIGFPVFCLGFSPVKSSWDLETLNFNEPVVMGKTQVRPGDILFGDETGIIVIPVEREDDILSKAKEIRNEEEKVLSKLLGQEMA